MFIFVGKRVFTDLHGSPRHIDGNQHGISLSLWIASQREFFSG
jgi:hypothetical protein